MRYAKGVAAALALSVASLSVAGTAEAGGRHYHHYHNYNNGGAAVAAGVVGLAAGAIIGSTLAQPRYYEPVPVYPAPRRVYVEPAPVRVYQVEPWTAEWYSYCADRYRSFDARSGTFMGYDGYRHFCE